MINLKRSQTLITALKTLFSVLITRCKKLNPHGLSGEHEKKLAYHKPFYVSQGHQSVTTTFSFSFSCTVLGLCLFFARPLVELNGRQLMLHTMVGEERVESHPSG